MNSKKYVAWLPDLMTPEDYADFAKKKIRFQIRLTDVGVEILGDAMYVAELEALLTNLGNHPMERTLCG